MSEPVTNVEIEDVLSSIRRLVAEGNKSQTHAKMVDEGKKQASKTAERFVLTPALRIADTPEDEAAAVQVEEAEPILNAESAAHASNFTAPAIEPLILEPAAKLDSAKVHDNMTPSERESLEATIAELEAAMSFQPDAEWEPDGSETQLTSGLAEAFAALDEEIEDAEEVAPQAEPERVVHLRPEWVEPTFRHVPNVEIDAEDDEDTDYGDDMRESDDDGMPIPDDLDETLAAYIAGGSSLDRAEIRQLVVEVVRQELQGELGERITRNVRKLVRREIHRATNSNLYD